MPRCPVIIPLNVTQSRVFAVRSPANGNAADAGNRPSALAPLRPGLLDSRRNNLVSHWLRFPSKNSNGVMFGLAEAASRAAALATVALFGVPRRRPPRRSPGFEPLGIAIFATFATKGELDLFKERMYNFDSCP